MEQKRPETLEVPRPEPPGEQTPPPPRREKTPSRKESPPEPGKLEQAGVHHVVERHQTLYRICKTYGVPLERVAAVNGIRDPGRIRAGQRIFIPGADRVLKVEIVIDDVALEAGSPRKEAAPSGPVAFLWPLQGVFSSGFEENERKRHQGIDLLSPAGTPVKAAAPGVALYAGDGIRGYGNMIILRHSDEYVTVYAHNEANLVAEGDRVEQGQIIARVGRTGRATAPHLHFEIRRNNRAVDPLPLLGETPQAK
jgi:murein DD-endopeptidase MepM/ murein hydrolase activator NlpD